MKWKEFAEKHSKVMDGFEERHPDEALKVEIAEGRMLVDSILNSAKADEEMKPATEKKAEKLFAKLQKK